MYTSHIILCAKCKPRIHSHNQPSLKKQKNPCLRTVQLVYFTYIVVWDGIQFHLLLGSGKTYKATKKARLANFS